MSSGWMKGLAFCISAAAACRVPPASVAIEKQVQVKGGIAFSIADEDVVERAHPAGTGGLVSGELVFKFEPAFSPRVYGGLILTWPDRASCGIGVEPCDVSSKLAFAGVKAHLTVPIPYVAPFVEGGIGGSAGSIATHVGAQYNRSHSGVAYHIPVAVGVALGETHAYEVSISYLYYPSYAHLDGALAFGFAFSLP
jgi:hypothetical protein